LVNVADCDTSPIPLTFYDDSYCDTSYRASGKHVDLTHRATQAAFDVLIVKNFRSGIKRRERFSYRALIELPRTCTATA
jgi:hypothetical protein